MAGTQCKQKHTPKTNNRAAQQTKPNVCCGLAARILAMSPMPVCVGVGARCGWEFRGCGPWPGWPRGTNHALPLCRNDVRVVRRPAVPCACAPICQVSYHVWRVYRVFVDLLSIFNLNVCLRVRSQFVCFLKQIVCCNVPMFNVALFVCLLWRARCASPVSSLGQAWQHN